MTKFPIADEINLDPAPTTIPVLEEPLFLPMEMVPSAKTVAPLLMIILQPGPSRSPQARALLTTGLFVQYKRLFVSETSIRLFDSTLTSPAQNSLPPLVMIISLPGVRALKT